MERACDVNTSIKNSRKILKCNLTGSRRIGRPRWIWGKQNSQINSPGGIEEDERYNSVMIVDDI